MRYARIADIEPGTILAVSVIGENNSVFLRAGAPLNNYVLGRLKSMGYSGVYIHDILSDDIVINENIPLDIKFRAASASTERNYDQCIYLSHLIAENLTHCSPEIYTSMSMISSYDSYTYMHSVNVATYAGMLGVILGMPLNQVEKLVLSAMLHDIGKTLIPEEIINKPDKLTDEEYELIKTHSQLGYEALKDNVDIPSIVRTSVLEHHENHDGTGYPNGLGGDQIYIFAKIIHVCDVYDAMVTRRAYKEAMNPCAVIEYIMSQSGKMFDPGIVMSFIKNIVPYPEGVLVLLSDGSEAIVKENNKHFIMRPKVVTIPDGKEINLMETLSLTIIKILV